MTNLQLIGVGLLVVTHAGCIGLGVLLALYWKSDEPVKPAEEPEQNSWSFSQQKKW